MAYANDVDLQYDTPEADRALAALAVFLACSAVYARSTAYRPHVSRSVDTAVVLLLFLVAVAGLFATGRVRDLAIGLPTGVFATALLGHVAAAALTTGPTVDASTGAGVGGLALLGLLFLREAVLVASGRRRRGVEEAPPARWPLWVVAAALVGYAFLG